MYFKNCSKIESFLYYSKRNGLIIRKIFNLKEIKKMDEHFLVKKKKKKG